MSAGRHRRAAELRARREERRRRTRRRRRVAVLGIAAFAGLVAGAVELDVRARVAEAVRSPGEAAAADEAERGTRAPKADRAGKRAQRERTAARKRKLAALRSARIEIAAVGDLALHDVPPAGLLDQAAPLLRGDVVLGNLEGTLSAGGVSKCARPESQAEAKRKRNEKRPPEPPTCFAFRAPPDYAAELRRAGFTVLNLANNHSADFGWQGQTETAAALASAGLGLTGFGSEPYVVRIRGVRVAVLGFAPLAAGWDLLDQAAAVASVRNAASRADVVVVTMHAGAEGRTVDRVRPGPETYLGEPRGDVVGFSRAVVRAGADLVVGHGPHVLRGMEWRRGRLVAYSLGNFATNGALNVAGPGGVGALLRVTLRGDGSWAGGRLVPIRLTPPGAPARDASSEAVGVVRRLSQADFGPRAARLAPDGRILARGDE